MRYPLLALGVVALYAIANAVLAGHPLALSIFGNVALVASAALAIAAIWSRRPSRAGCLLYLPGQTPTAGERHERLRSG